FDGLLGFRQVSIGSYIQPGVIIATLIDDSEMNLDFMVPETVLRSVAPGITIEASTDSFPGEIFHGTVATLDNVIDPVTRAVRVRAVLPNEDGLLKAGMFMQVTALANPRSAPSIPEEAVEPVGPLTFVYVISNDDGQKIAQRREVTLGARQAGQVEIVDGISAGDLIVKEGLLRVRSGQPVAIQNDIQFSPPPAAGSGSSGAAGAAD
ncbi:MAG: efflux RND transporter periplasmic adaptor subunit, partial [Pseudomonadota bacterium]